MGEQALSSQIRRRWLWYKDGDRSEFLQWLEGELNHVDGHSSESDDE